MQVAQTVNMRLGISGTLVFADANGNEVGAMHISGSAPLVDDQDQDQDQAPNPGAPAPELTTEQSHGPDHR